MIRGAAFSGTLLVVRDDPALPSLRDLASLPSLGELAARFFFPQAEGGPPPDPRGPCELDHLKGVPAERGLPPVSERARTP